MSTASSAIADFVQATDSTRIPAEVIEHGKLCLLDTIGCGLFGSTLPQSSIVADMLVAAGSRGDTAVWGRAERLTAPDAALVNGTSVHAFELDDLHPRSIVHPGSVVASAAVAAASLRPRTSGLDLLVATILGYEVSARVGSTMGAAHLIAGWHPTGTHGTLGAAAAASKVLGLDVPQIAHALGTAGSQAGGLMAAQYESMVKRFHAGRAAQSGVYSALLAERGYAGIKDVFEAPFGGYLSTFSPHADASWLTDGLGTAWEALNAGFKPYATNGSCHPSIDCLRELYLHEGVRAEDVDSVDFWVSTATDKHVGWPYVPDTVTTAQMNLGYIAAVVLTDGEAFVDQFTDERIRDPELVSLSARVHVNADPEIDALGDAARHKTRLRVTMRDGRTFDAERDHGHGSSKDPMSTAEVREKFRRLAGTVLDEARVDRLEHVIEEIDSADDLAGLIGLLAHDLQP